MAQGDFTRINTNIGAFNALNSLKNVQKQMGTHQLRLATGRRINEAADDPAGLTIATKFQYRASGLGVALDNIGDAKNMLAVAEGGLTKINDILIKMRDKAEQAASDTLGADERTAIDAQLKDWSAEIDSIVNTTKWNGKKLLDGLSEYTGNQLHFQVGADTAGDDRITLTNANFGSAATSQLGISSGAATATEVAASDASDIIASGAGVACLSGLPELNSGTYTIRLVSDGGAGADYAQLVDASGNILTVDGDGADNGLLDNKVTTTIANGGTINFGNGLQVTLGGAVAALAAGTYTAQLTYTRGGTYSGDVSTADGAQLAMNDLDTAIQAVSTRLQTVGSLVSRLNFREETLTVAKVNVEAAHNRIMNADMAFEQLEATKMSILQQTAITMLSQANSAPQNVLSLFR